jgi:hypothetical protein
MPNLKHCKSIDDGSLTTEDLEASQDPARQCLNESSQREYESSFTGDKAQLSRSDQHLHTTFR